ncbi:molybdopterin oxidoreductase [Rhodococcus sp. 14-2496-1d]|uniref:molybdopterin-dependent oxidoreductase n=1 Tax=Rhodococcus sp. 14-2496-1d TaxID=2023146 RepID=UPI000B9BE651|nr:molybdopterin-dependent oxidoreductase [Rhodococcus sp. 14-2496-1d]OZF25665.1 molybdopterin oxidoreductase [Rhodococcus sp. 14-2496-1d]
MANANKLDWQKTACILCENNCGVIVRTEGRAIVKIRGDQDHPRSLGYTCNKALQLDHYQNGGTRLDTPMRREADGSYTAVGWDIAIREVAARLGSVRDAHGGKSIFFYGGGGQGNHLGGAYSGALMRGLGARYRSNALAQEKTGEGWVDAHLTGGHTVGDFERAQVSVFIGKNPWQSHGVARARTVLQEIGKDPDRSMIVLDPVRSDTAARADLHLQIRPGTDAWCLAAILAVIVEDDLLDHDFLRLHTRGVELVLPTILTIDVAAYALICGVEERDIRSAAYLIGTAESVSTYEDLGVQQGPNSTLVSYLNKLIWLLTGNFAKSGAMQNHSWLAPLADYSLTERRTPVHKTPIFGGLVPGNVIAEEISNDHPDRFRAMVIESSNPAHSLADSQRFVQAMEDLEFSVVIDVAMTETARRADYVLPASSQFEKWEATFFSLEFPHNSFQLRAPILEPLPGTLSEPEIYSRLIAELGLAKPLWLTVLRTALKLGRKVYAAAFLALLKLDRDSAALAPYLLYETLGPTLPHGAKAASVLWALTQKLHLDHPRAVHAAGHKNAESLFTAILENRSGVNFTVDDLKGGAWRYVPVANQPVSLAIAPLLSSLASLRTASPKYTSEEFPFVLSAGERRAFTANTIFRDESWRKRGGTGALRMNPSDAANLSLVEGDRATITTNRGSATAVVEVTDAMQPGHISLPNGFGLDLAGGSERVGVAPNDLTDSDRRDEYSSTPWHKHVPARVEAWTGGR